jgi:hypothetical protein
MSKDCVSDCNCLTHLFLEGILQGVYVLDLNVCHDGLIIQNHSLTHSLMQLISSWEAANCAATQELTSILWKPKVHYRNNKSPPLVPILNQINPIHAIPFYLRHILILSAHLLLGLPSRLFPSGLPTNILYAFLFSPIRVTCPDHLILLHLIILIILGE